VGVYGIIIRPDGYIELIAQVDWTIINMSTVDVDEREDFIILLLRSTFE